MGTKNKDILDLQGLQTYDEKIKNYVTNSNTTYTLSAGSGDDSNKIILTPSSGTANKVTVPFATDAGTVNGKTVAVNVPADAKFTDTTYTDATTSASGLMSSTDKTKLNGVANGAEVNQNAFSNIVVGGATVTADSKTDSVEFVAGNNVTITPDTTNDKITINATDTTYTNATTSAAGLMSTEDKSKLDGVEVGAQKNATGEVKTATDEFSTANGGLLDKCVIDLAPIQPLHGYDHPWVGGAGKNKASKQPINYNTNNYGAMLISLNADTYTVSHSGRTCKYYIREDDGQTTINTGTSVADSGYVNSFTFTIVTAGLYKIQMYASSWDEAPTNLQIEIGETATSYEPYENICPISGHTEVDLYNVGKNRFNPSMATVGNRYSVSGDVFTVLSATGTIAISQYTFLANTTYTINITMKSGTVKPCIIIRNPNESTEGQRTNFSDTSKPLTFSFTQDTTWNILLQAAGMGSVISVGDTFVIQLELGSTATPYEPYLGHLYTVQIGQTVYGGSGEMVSGNCNSIYGYVDLGSLNWSKGTYFSSGDIASLCKKPAYSEVANAYCECFKVTSRANVDIHSEDNLISIQQDGSIVIYASQYADVPTFITAVSGKKFVFELATPTTLNHTPQNIETLVGENNLSTPLDGQNIDSVKYREVFVFDDVEKIVNLRVPISMLGTDESGRTTASQSYASGDYFYKDGYMCKALTSISAGATLTLNTNYSQATLDEVLESKVDKEQGKALSTNDFTDAYKTKLTGIEDGAQVNPVPGEQTAVDSFTTETGGLLKSAVVELSPIQDLHGYDNPWPAGANVNIISNGTDASNGYMYHTYIKQGGSTASHSDYNVSEYCPAVAGETYTYCSYPNTSSGSIAMCFYDSSKQYLTGIKIGDGVATITAPANTAYFRATYETSSNDTYKLLVCKGSTKPETYSPYSNICPIDGHEQTQLQRDGKNFLPTYTSATSYGIPYTVNEDGSVSYSGTQQGNTDSRIFSRVTLKAGTYIVSGASENSSLGYGDMYVNLADGTILARDYSGLAESDSTFTLTEDTFLYIALRGAPKNSSAVVSGKYYPMIRKATDDATYEPYQGQLYTLSFDDKVYGGTVDFVTGVMNVTRFLGVLDGTKTLGVYTNTRRFAAYLSTLGWPNAKLGTYASENTAEAICSQGSYVTGSTSKAKLFDFRLSLDNGISFYDPSETVADAAAFKTLTANLYAAGTPVTVCYLIAEPFTVQLTPQQIEALVGQNNLSALLEKQEVISATYEQISAFNEVIDNNHKSEISTYSSEKIDADFVAKTAGDVKTATDQFSTINGGLLQKCVVDLVPVQDLHGYDNPWPVGGGKNLLPMTVDGIKEVNTEGTWDGDVYTVSTTTFELLKNNSNNVIGVKVNGTPATNTILRLPRPEINISYILNGCPSGGSGTTYRLSWYHYDGTTSAIDNGNGTVAFTPTSTALDDRPRITIYNGYTASNLIFYPMLRLATETDASFAPYSNICSISGHTEVDLLNDGKNKADISHAGNATNVISGVSSDGIISIKDATAQWSNTYIGTVYLHGGVEYTMSASNMVYGRFGLSNSSTTFPKDGTYIPCVNKASNFTGNLITRNRTSVTFTPVNSGFAYIWYCSDDQYSSYHATFSTTLQLEKGSVATPYEHYQGELYTIQLGSTYYGGYIDVVSGNLVLTHKIVDFGDLGWAEDSTFFAQITDAKPITATGESSNILCELYKTKLSGYSSTYPNDDFIIYRGASESANYVRVKDSRYANASDFKTGVTGYKFTYELATPQTIQLLPSQIEALSGENNLSTPLDGQSIEIDGVEYRPVAKYNNVIDDESISMNPTGGFENTTYSSRYINQYFRRKNDFKYTSAIICPMEENYIDFYDDAITTSKYCELLQVSNGTRVVVTDVQVSTGHVRFTFASPSPADSTFVCCIRTYLFL